MSAQAPHPIPTLPLHLMMMSGWLGCLGSSQAAGNALPHWNMLQNTLPDLQKLAASQASDVLQGILRYQDASYTPPPVDKPVLWQEGSSRLLDYRKNSAENSGGKPITLFVPSLINRHYILDLAKNRSLLAFLADKGQQPLVLDWGTPGDAEQPFGCDEYITRRLILAIRHAQEISGQPVILAGYCMGGVLSLAAAQLAPESVKALALLATPWDFHCRAFAPFILDAAYHKQVEQLLEAQGMVPAAMIQAMFYLTDPFVFEQKYRRFFHMQPGSREAEEFIALEHWVNDGVPMTTPLAKECLLGWAQQNQLAQSKWAVAGKRINPKKIKQPAFLAIPQNDHVVPQDCAQPLAELLPQATAMYPEAGHVSMVVGNKAKQELWQPLLQWLRLDKTG